MILMCPRLWGSLLLWKWHKYACPLPLPQEQSPLSSAVGSLWSHCCFPCVLSYLPSWVSFRLYARHFPMLPEGVLLTLQSASRLGECWQISLRFRILPHRNTHKAEVSESTSVQGSGSVSGSSPLREQNVIAAAHLPLKIHVGFSFYFLIYSCLWYYKNYFLQFPSELDSVPSLWPTCGVHIFPSAKRKKYYPT